jgi:hypothetical protein
MVRKKLSEIKTLIGRLVTIGVLVLIGVLVYRWWFSNGQNDDFVIDNTPLHVEEIRKIVELNTIRFHDEVVVDSVEYYRNLSEQIAGNYEKLYDPDQIRHGIYHSNVRRRLTLIVKGELLYGFDLKRKELIVLPKEGKLIVRVPNPELLSVNLTPENTEIFVENGEWKDYERQLLQRKARLKMIASGERLRLEEKAKKPLEKLLQQLIRSDKPIVVEYY